MNNQKGVFLSSLILVFGLAISLATVILIFDGDIRNLLGNFPGWFNTFLILFLLARLMALYAIWDLKQWGVYVFLFLECIEVAMGLFVFTAALALPFRGVMVMASFLVVLAIWFLALRPKWQLFT